MQNIKIEVKVTLPSGASVGLTDGQNTKINSFITELLFGQAEKVKRTYTRHKGTKRPWSKEEDELLMPAITITSKGEAANFYRKVKPKLRRTSIAICNRVYHLRNVNKQHLTNVPVTNWLS